MADENKVNTEVDSSTFAQPVPEKTELERLQERIANYKVSITPNVAQFTQILMQQALEKPTKIEDLDAFITIRNELKEGLDDYQLQLKNANARMVQLQEQHTAQKQMELAQREEDLKDARNAERKRRKDAEEKARQLEAVLKSHGIFIDIDGDGEIGLQDGESAEPLDAEQQKTLKQLLDEKYPERSGGTSPAFAKARSMNPVSEEDGGYADTYSNPETIEGSRRVNMLGEPVGDITLEVPEDAKGTDEFIQESEEVAKTSPDDFEEVGFDANGAPTTEFDNKPVISDTNSPAIIEEEIAKTPVRIVPEDEIADFEKKVAGTKEEDYTEETQHFENPSDPSNFTADEELADKIESTKKSFKEWDESQEEEFEEVVIPTESELKGMTKSKIKAEASKLGFTGVSTKDTKSDMINNFQAATQEFITGLQDSGEFVSATDSDSEEDNETEDKKDVRDGGYFD